MILYLHLKKTLGVISVGVLLNAATVNMACAQNPVETKATTADFKPAFPGQTRAPGVTTKTAIDVNVINSSLKSPWGLAIMPDGRFLISQKQGTMVILSIDGTSEKVIEGLPKVNAGGQGGLLDVTLDPKFKENKMIYWTYSEPQDDGNILLAVAKGKLSKEETTIEDQKIIYRATPSYKDKLQYGSRIVFDKNGNLFVSTGERSGADIRVQAQYLDSSLGKVIHITKDGKAVPNGPFAKNPNARPEIYAYGFRNPDGFAINPATGDLWEAEFGPKGGDEVNIIKPGKNYGWPIITYGTEYSGKMVGEGITQKDGMEQPVYYWNPSISPGCMAFYYSDVIPEWKGNLFMGALGGQHIARLIIKNDKIVGEERLLVDKSERFRDMAQGLDGAMYTVTDGGKLYKISKK